MFNSLLHFLCRIFPIRRKKILFISHLGKNISCNPKYLCDYIQEFHSSEFDLYFAYDSNVISKPDTCGTCKYIDINSKRFIYELNTCRFLISNTRIPLWFKYPHKKNQTYIQTWHSSLRLKKIEGDANLSKEYESFAKKDSAQTDYLLSGCKLSSEIFNRAFWFNGSILESGTPRIDYLLSTESFKKNEFLDTLKLNHNYKYALYAPTFRTTISPETFMPDFVILSSALKQKFGGDWKILVRMHPNHLEKYQSLKLPDCCINASYFPDIQELLICADCLITDYSSSMFDALYLKMPCFLYVADYQQYLQDERGTYFHLDKLPFPIIKSNTEVHSIICNFSAEKYMVDIEIFMTDIGSYESGNACQKIYSEILSKK